MTASAGAASLGLAAGPVVGGAITGVANWRAGFMLSVVLGVITVALGFRVISRARYGQPAHPVRPDFMGAGLSTLTLAALTYGLIDSATLGWSSPLIIVVRPRRRRRARALSRLDRVHAAVLALGHYHLDRRRPPTSPGCAGGRRLTYVDIGIW
jgi:MFS family permease